MNTSAEQIHQEKLNIKPKKGKDLRFFIDLLVKFQKCTKLSSLFLTLCIPKSSPSC